MCNLFVNSLKTKGETFTVKSAANVEKEQKHGHVSDAFS